MSNSIVIERARVIANKVEQYPDSNELSPKISTFHCTSPIAAVRLDSRICTVVLFACDTEQMFVTSVRKYRVVADLVENMKEEIVNVRRELKNTVEGTMEWTDTDGKHHEYTQLVCHLDAAHRRSPQATAEYQIDCVIYALLQRSEFDKVKSTGVSFID